MSNKILELTTEEAYTLYELLRLTQSKLRDKWNEGKGIYEEPLDEKIAVIKNIVRETKEGATIKKTEALLKEKEDERLISGAGDLEKKLFKLL